ncbi:hypothetical protein JQX13_14280 [Archangium violaceum]|uniref:hypothetical protein n=1 Tax=Archangium violaceum TaxID=83451 RepID=UPI00193B86E3|nr:hypothetical protein [Archangium violaceum]QRK11130.1 hypothetical protein JQX13_14280 [Archangium violaceum]
MDRSMSVPTGVGEHSLTPGEQRILTLMEQGQQRLEQGQQLLEQRLQGMDQRLQSLEHGQQRTEQQLKELTLKVDHEAAASRIRDLQLAADLQGLRHDNQERLVRLQGQLEQSLQKTQESVLTTLYFETNKLRTEFSERFDRHNARLEIVEQTLELYGERIRDNTQALQGQREDVRKQTTGVEGLAQAPRTLETP